MTEIQPWKLGFASATALPERAGWRLTTTPERILWIELAEAGPATGPAQLFAGDPNVFEYRYTAPALALSVVYARTEEGMLAITVMVTNQQHSPASALIHARLGGLGNTYTPVGADETGLAQMGPQDACVLLTGAPEASWSVEQDGAGLDLNLDLPANDKRTIIFAYTHATGRPTEAVQAAASLAEQVLAEHASGIWPPEGPGDILLEKR